jgi:predicted dehydrogenase
MRPAEAALVLGYGSIGRRFCRVLHEAGMPLTIVNRREDIRLEAAADFPSARVVDRLEALDGEVVDWEGTLAVIATWGPSHAPLFHALADRGVKRILCEKPLANSVAVASGMVERAEREHLVLAAHHDLRYAGLAAALRRLLDEHGLGEPVTVVAQGGAAGLLTNGIHWIDFATELFGEAPRRVASTARPEYINPRSPELVFEGGSAIWSFGDCREAVVSFSNRSSVAYRVRVLLRDATADIAYRGEGTELYLHLTLRRRGAAAVRGLAITRTGPADKLLFDGLPPGAERFYGGLRAATRDAAAASGTICPGAAGAAAVTACIGALIAGRDGRSVDLPLDTRSVEGREAWPIS